MPSVRDIHPLKTGRDTFQRSNQTDSQKDLRVAHSPMHIAECIPAARVLLQKGDGPADAVLAGALGSTVGHSGPTEGLRIPAAPLQWPKVERNTIVPAARA